MHIPGWGWAHVLIIVLKVNNFDFAKKLRRFPKKNIPKFRNLPTKRS